MKGYIETFFFKKQKTKNRVHVAIRNKQYTQEGFGYI